MPPVAPLRVFEPAPDPAPPAPAPPGAVIARLRALLPAGRVQPGRLACQHGGLDAWLGGWPCPGVSEICGAPGSGRLALILPALEQLARAGRPVVVVDPWQQFYPPGGAALDLRSLVLVRPAPEQAAWAAEQVARSGAVEALLVLDPPPLGRAGVRLGRAAEAGRLAVWVVSSAPDPALPAGLRLVTDGWDEGALRVRCTRGPGRVEGERRIALPSPVAGP